MDTKPDTAFRAGAPGAGAVEDGRRRRPGGLRRGTRLTASRLYLPSGARGRGRRGGAASGGPMLVMSCQEPSQPLSEFSSQEQQARLATPRTSPGGGSVCFDHSDADSVGSGRAGGGCQSLRTSSRYPSPSSSRRRHTKSPDSDSRSPLGLRKTAAKANGDNDSLDKECPPEESIETDTSPFWAEQQMIAEALLKRTGLPTSRRVTVVGFLGRSRSGAKSRMLSISSHVKGSCTIGENGTISESWCLVPGDSKEEGIFMCVDKTRGTIYLDLRGGLDGDLLAECLQDATRTRDSEDFYEWLSAHQHFGTLASLFIFLMSHIVILSHPSAGDTATISQLHLLAVAKRQLATYAADFVRRCWVEWGVDPPTNATWVSPTLRERRGGEVLMGSTPSGGTLMPGTCVPVLCFAFQEVSLPRSVDGRLREIDIYYRTQASLQSRLRFLFRSCHITKPADSNLPFDSRQLFVLPPVLPSPNALSFVHLIPRGMDVPVSRIVGNTSLASEDLDYTDALSSMLAIHDSDTSSERLFRSLRTKKASDAASPTGTASSTRGFMGHSPATRSVMVNEDTEVRQGKIYGVVETVSTLLETFRSIGGSRASFSGPSKPGMFSRSSNAASQTRGVLPLRSLPHVGSDDELPSAEAWTAAAIAMRLFLFKASDRDVVVPPNFRADMMNRKAAYAAEEMAKRLENVWKVDAALSESHCRQCMRKALDAYLLDLPRIYTQKYHQMKLDRSVSLYRLAARGPCFENCLTHLEASCTQIWKNERRRSENVSLPGHECARPHCRQSNPETSESRRNG